jgi:hypothetical protein
MFLWRSPKQRWIFQIFFFKEQNFVKENKKSIGMSKNTYIFDLESSNFIIYVTHVLKLTCVEVVQYGMKFMLKGH